MKEIKITLKTLTPLWTGDAWRDNNTIRPSSLMGSLRFWFEVICYFSGITNNNDYKNGELETNLDENKFKENLVKNGANLKTIDKSLAECGIPLPARVFGCTGWKGWIRIKEIRIIRNNNYNYPLGKIDFEDLKYKKKYFDKKEKKEIIPAWYFSKGFHGKFSIIFEIEEKILQPIFYPLLTFMEQYGFLGGGWNIGYGRLQIEKIEDKENGNWQEINEWQKEQFKFSKFYENRDENYSDKGFTNFININTSLSINSQSFDYLKYFLNIDSFYCSSERDFNTKITNIPEQIRAVKLNYQNNNIKEIIKELLNKKVEVRGCLRPNNYVSDKSLWHDFRHKLLGTTSGGTEGTKIIPWIYEDYNDRTENGNPQLKGGFISIAGILNLGGRNEL